MDMVTFELCSVHKLGRGGGKVTWADDCEYCFYVSDRDKEAIFVSCTNLSAAMFIFFKLYDVFGHKTYLGIDEEFKPLLMEYVKQDMGERGVYLQV